MKGVVVRFVLKKYKTKCFDSTNTAILWWPAWVWLVLTVEKVTSSWCFRVSELSLRPLWAVRWVLLLDKMNNHWAQNKSLISRWWGSRWPWCVRLDLACGPSLVTAFILTCCWFHINELDKEELSQTEQATKKQHKYPKVMLTHCNSVLSSAECYVVFVKLEVTTCKSEKRHGRVCCCCC